jgi:hypothetical protein
VRRVKVRAGVALAVGIGFSVSALAGVAVAVSAGGFSSSQQDCTQDAMAQGTPDGYVQPGCHLGAVNLSDGHGNRYAEFGLNQLPNGGPSGTPGLLSLGYPGADNSPHAGCLALNTNGTGGGTGTGCGSGPGGLGFSAPFDYYTFYCPIVTALGSPCGPTGATGVSTQNGTPDIAGLITNLLTSGTQAYIGMSDNLDAGEHDGVDPAPLQTCTDLTCSEAGANPNKNGGSINGPSDGGAISLVVQPQNAAAPPSWSDPLGLATFGFGACFDGNCIETTTATQTIYQGCSPGNNQSADVQCAPGKENSSRNAADYSNKNWDPQPCSSGDATSAGTGPQGCGPAGMDSYRQSEAHNVTAAPGVTVFEDPDPQGSPVGLYPLPAVYVGTCGVIIGGGQGLPALPASPLTNSAGQLVISTGC